MVYKPIILTFIQHYLPGYKFGGPVRTISNMVEQLGDELNFFIITSDRDAFDNCPYPSVKIDMWNTVGKAKIYYASPQKLLFWNLVRLIKETPHDILYFNSFFNPVFTFKLLLARLLGLISKKPVVLAPRGEFSEGALAIKAWKKRPYICISKLIGLYKNITWQASNEQEVSDIKKVMGTIAKNIVVASNLPPVKKVSVCGSKTFNKGPLRIVFLSLITPKKNLDFALQVLSHVQLPVAFDIYGPIWDQSYWRNCQRLIKELPSNISVNYLGSLPPVFVPEILSTYDLFFLPTKGENFGHVVLEALSVGTPVLISDKTPWAEDDEGGCTVRKLGDLKGFVTAIEKFGQCSQNELLLRRMAALKLANKYNYNKLILDQNLNLFKNLC